MDQDEKDLRDLAESDKKAVIKILEYHRLKVVENKIEMLFSDSEVDISKLEQITFKELHRLKYEPSMVYLKFLLIEPIELHRNITVILENILYKITNRIELDLPNKILDTSTVCPHFKLIKTKKIKGQILIQMFGTICYCS